MLTSDFHHGLEILYTGLNEAGEEGGLWVVNSDGTGAHRLCCVDG
jgi:hypothetical protein